MKRPCRAQQPSDAAGSEPGGIGTSSFAANPLPSTPDRNPTPIPDRGRFRQVPSLLAFSLRTLLLLTLSLGLSLPGLLVGQVYLRLQHEQLASQLKDDELRLTHILALGLQQPVWELNTTAARKLVEAILDDTRVIAVTVTEQVSGDRFLHVDRPTRRVGRSHKVRAPVEYNGGRIADVELEVDIEHLVAQRSANAHQLATLVGIQLVMSLLLIAAVLQFRLVAPLQRLARQATQLASLDLGKPFAWHRNDEIGQLGRHLEWARAELAALLTELERKNLALEADIRQREQIEEALRRSETKYRELFVSNLDGIVITDLAGRCIDANPAFLAMVGIRPSTLPGTPLAALSPPEWAEVDREALEHEILQHGYCNEYEKEFLRPNASRFPASVKSILMRDEQARPSGVFTIIRDISERKAADERIQYLAMFDVLTGLPNRSQIEDRLNIAIAGAQRDGTRLAVLFLDLDRFKTINDSLGHSIGDLLLQEVGHRIKSAMRAGDTVGRLGGDEFIILVPAIDATNDAAFVANRVLELVGQPYQIQGHELTVTPSIGISVYPDDADDYESLVRNADAAMYHAKGHGRNNFQFYTADMNAMAHAVLAMESQIRRGLEREEFILHYQPLVDLPSGRIVGAEALVRWQHPEQGLMPPDRFIPIAEERGLIVPLGTWVLREAVRQNAEWHMAGMPPIAVAVNLSGAQFARPDLADTVAAALAEFRLPPELLELEVTETIILHDVESTITTLQALNDMGVGLSIDDFGTGYSSLSYLKRFNVDKLKIDRSFVRDIPADPDDTAITRTIIALARNMGLKVVAEGVETDDQWQFLAREGCNQIQGYRISRPIPAAAFAELVRTFPGEP